MHGPSRESVQCDQQEDILESSKTKKYVKEQTARNPRGKDEQNDGWTYLQGVRVNLPQTYLTIITACDKWALITRQEDTWYAVSGSGFPPQHNRHHQICSCWHFDLTFGLFQQKNMQLSDSSYDFSTRWTYYDTKQLFHKVWALGDYYEFISNWPPILSVSLSRLIYTALGTVTTFIPVQLFSKSSIILEKR